MLLINIPEVAIKQYGATYNLQQTIISNFAVFSIMANKAWCFMRISCCSQNLSPAAVVIGTLRAKDKYLALNLYK